MFPLLPVRENVRLAAEARLGGARRIWRRAGAVREALERADWALERVGLSRRAAAPAGSLAHGDKRRLELAMVLAGDPRVILLDEPMAGVSVENVHELVELIRTVHAEERKTVLMVEHHIEVVTGLADRIAVMHHGRAAGLRHAGGDHGQPRGAAGLRRGGAVTALLEVRDLHVRLGGSHVLQGVSFEVPEGAVTALLGPQRRRQDDDAARAARPRARARGTRRSAAPTSSASRRTASSAAASATCPRTATSSRR